MMLDDRFHSLILLAVIGDLFGGKAQVVNFGAERLLMNDDQLMTFAVWQRAKEDAINDAEDGRVGPDAEGQSDDRRQRKATITEQHSEPVANILSERFNKILTAAVGLFLSLSPLHQ